MSENEEQSAKAAAGKGKERWAPLEIPFWLLVPQFFLDHYSEMGLTPGQAMFVLHLLRYKRGDNAINPKIQTLADLMGLSYNQIRKYMTQLKALGYLNVTRAKGKPCVFDLRPLCENLEKRRKDLAAAELARFRRRGGYGSA